MLLTDVYLAPGHLIRRAQQIAVAIFFKEFEGWEVTPIQYAALIAIRERPGMDQRTLVNYIAIDRSTVGSMSKGLEERKLIYRVTPKEYQRIKQLFIKPAGERLLDDTRDIIARAQDRILAPLDDENQAVFMELLTRLCHVAARRTRRACGRQILRRPLPPSATCPWPPHGRCGAFGRMSGVAGR